MYIAFCHFLLPLFLPTCTLPASAGQMANQQEIMNLPFSKNCTTSAMKINHGEYGVVDISPYDPASNNMFPKMHSMNASTWELYFFDAVSPSSSAITLSFFREGHQLKVQFLAMWPDGEIFMTEFLAQKSTIEECAAEGLKGVWQGEQNGSVSFDITEDLKAATCTIDLPAIAQGTISFSPTTSPWTPDIPTNLERDALRLLTPTVYWLQPMPRASVQVDMQIEGKGLAFTGLGGHDRFWSPHSWMTMMDESIFLRAHAGPYTLLMLRIMSRIDRGVPHASVYLFEDDKRIFATQNERVSLSNGYYSFKRTYSGDVAGSFLDSSTGAVVDLVSPQEGKQWTFEVEHASVWWNMPTGATGTGNSGFIDKVVGGEVGKESFEGTGTAGVCQLPKLPKND